MLTSHHFDDGDAMHNAIKNNLKYISLALCAFFFAYQYGIKSVIPSVLNEELRQYFSINASQMGSLMGLSMAAYTLMQLIAGPIVDRFQAKKVFSIAFSIMSISGAVFLLQNDFLIAQVSQFIVGCAAAFPFVLVMKVSNEYFDREQVSIASSTAIAIGCAGPVVFNPLLTNLMVIFHWRIVSIAFCLFGLIVAVCSLFFMQNETKNEVSGTIAEENDKSHDRTPLQGIKLLLNPQFLLCGLFGGAVLGSSATFFDAWGLVFLKTVYGFDSKQASYFISVGYIGVILGMPLIALWAKHIQSYKKVMLICVVLLAITLSMLVFIKMPNYGMQR